MTYISDTRELLAQCFIESIILLICIVKVQFKRSGINSVFNLQEPGEHATCGPGIIKHSGFSYTPEIFMENNCR